MDGILNTAPACELVGEWLTTWSVSPDGSRVGLGFADASGQPCRLDLPTEAVNALLLTLPRILQHALDARGDPAARIVQPLGAWRLEQATDPGRLILTLTTPDGFGVAFSLAPNELVALGQAAQPDADDSCRPNRVLN